MSDANHNKCPRCGSQIADEWRDTEGQRIVEYECFSREYGWGTFLQSHLCSTSALAACEPEQKEEG